LQKELDKKQETYLLMEIINVSRSHISEVGFNLLPETNTASIHCKHKTVWHPTNHWPNLEIKDQMPLSLQQVGLEIVRTNIFLISKFAGTK
jgi:hypothetical protein